MTKPPKLVELGDASELSQGGGPSPYDDNCDRKKESEGNVDFLY